MGLRDTHESKVAVVFAEELNTLSNVGMIDQNYLSMY
jgi:hypothetical protein